MGTEDKIDELCCSCHHHQIKNDFKRATKNWLTSSWTWVGVCWKKRCRKKDVCCCASSTSLVLPGNALFPHQQPKKDSFFQTGSAQSWNKLSKSCLAWLGRSERKKEKNVSWVFSFSIFVFPLRFGFLNCRAFFEGFKSSSFLAWECAIFAHTHTHTHAQLMRKFASSSAAAWEKKRTEIILD